MQESYSEGLAIHTGPESCGYAGNDIPEALTGVHAGWVLSRESIDLCSERRRCRKSRKATPNVLLWQETFGLRAVEDPMHAWKLFAQELGYPMFGLVVR